MNTTRNKRLILGGEYDIKKMVGPRQHFTTIEELILKCPAPALVDGLLVEDMNYSVTWQLYQKDGDWKYRLYDGTFYVAAVTMGSPTVDSNGFKNGHTADGYALQDDDIVLVVNYSAPHMNALWIVDTAGTWTRHPIFDNGTIDNIYGVIFVPMNGTNYKYTQWVFTTPGEITISNNPSDFLTATWLDFEQLTPTKNFDLQSISTSGSIGRYHKNTYVDASSADVEVVAIASIFLNVEYNVFKEDQSANYVIINSSSLKPLWVLLEQNDYVTFLSTEAGDGYKFKSNRKNLFYQAAEISADGKLSIDPPAGYLLWAIFITASDTISFDIGTTSGASDIASAEECGTTEVVVEVKDEVAEVWLKESTETGWGSITADCKLLLVKLENDAINVTNVNAATYNTLDTDIILNVSYTATGTVAIQLMDTRLAISSLLVIKDSGGNAGTNNITISTEGASTIDGAATAVINSDYSAIEIYTDGTNYFIK